MAHPEFRGFWIFWRFGDLGEYSYSLPSCFLFHWFASCFHILYVTYLLLLSYYAWQTLRGRCILDFWYVITCPAIISDLSVSCFLLTHVYHLTSSVLSLDYLARPYCYVMADPAYYQSIVMFYCLMYITIVMLSLYTKHDTLVSYNYHDKGNVVPDYCYVLITVMYSCYDIAHSRNRIIMFISYKKDNLYGNGRKWWMPEWYLAYSMGIGLAVVNLLLNRGTLGLQNWSQVYGNYYKKLYQFSIYFR